MSSIPAEVASCVSSMRNALMNSVPPPADDIVGNYFHDLLISSTRNHGESDGGKVTVSNNVLKHSFSLA